MVAFALSTTIYTKLGPKYTFSLLLLSSALSGYVILFFGYSANSKWVFPILVLFASFGTAASFTLCYVA